MVFDPAAIAVLEEAVCSFLVTFLEKALLHAIDRQQLFIACGDVKLAAGLIGLKPLLD